MFKRWVQKIKRWPVNVWHYLRFQLNKLRSQTLRLLRQIMAVRWHDIVWFGRNIWQAVSSYVKNTPPKQMLIDAKELALMILEAMWRRVNRNWKSRTLTAFIALILLMFGVFHHYLANVNRLYGIYDSAYSAVSSARRYVTEINNRFALSPGNQDAALALVESTRTSAADLAQITASQPRQIYIRYSLRNIVGSEHTVNLLDNNQPQIAIDQATYALSVFGNYADAVLPVLYFSDSVEETEKYRTIVSRSKSAVAEIDKNRSAIDTRQTVVILQAIEAEADLFLASQNQVRFERGNAQLIDELRKEIIEQWGGLVASILPNLSEYESDYERLLFFIANNVPGIDRR